MDFVGAIFPCNVRGIVVSKRFKMARENETLIFKGTRGSFTMNDNDLSFFDSNKRRISMDSLGCTGRNRKRANENFFRVRK